MKNHVLGICFLALVVGAVGLTYAIYTKQFTEYARVEASTSRIGLQLPDRADVKARGRIIGKVLEKEATDGGAVVTLGIYPDEIEKIPADVTASILPKTLFGQKFVSLEEPDQPAGQALQAGGRIERTDVATEVEAVLSSVYPLLTAVQPGQINMTLNALATALEGRGEQIGENLETLDGYLRRLNPQVPALVEDLRLTADVSNLYRGVLPDLSQILRNTIKTTGTLESKEERLNALFTDVTRFSGVARGFLDKNEQNLIRVAELAEPQFRLLAKYAPEYPCLLKGIVNAGKRNAETFRGFTLHINLELLPNQPRGYTPADQPRYGETRGPYCGTLPNAPFDQQNPRPAPPDFDDGIDEPTGKGIQRAPADYSPAGPVGFVGSRAEQRMLESFIGPALGESPEDVSDLGPLLVGPMARGAEVSLR